MMQFNHASHSQLHARVGRRWTVSMSILSAAALLTAIFATAPAARAQAPASPARLQSLVNDAVAQLQLSYRHDPAERQQRYEAIGRAIAAWNKSTRSQADQERLADWLRRAMRTSMPGSREPLPALPEFAPPAAAVKPTAESEPSSADLPAGETTRATTDHATTNRATSDRAADSAVDAEAESEHLPAARPAQPDAAERFDNLIEGDPFRDDPLPADK